LVLTTNLDAGHVLGETLVLLADLEGQLAGMTHDDDRNLKRQKIVLTKPVGKTQY
jgi:hypothetical protein